MKKSEVLKNVKRCPVCGSNEFTLIDKIEYPEGLLKISRCNTCSVSFSSTRFSDEYLKVKYYSKNYEEEIVGDQNYEETSEQFFQGIVDKVKKLKNSGEWLDIGCGRGYLLDIASKNNFDCYGIDANDDFIDNKKIKFFNKNLFETDFNNGKFDIVSMINVLDHLGSPGEYLGKIYDLLGSDRILYIHVPNEYYFNKKVFNKFTGYCPNVHLVNYSEKNISSILKRFNFSKIEFVSPKYKTIGGKKEMLYLLETFNNLAIKWNGGIWISMQVIAYK